MPIRPASPIAIAGATLAACSAATLAQPRYTVALIAPLADHTSLSTNAINTQGDVVGVSYGSPISNQLPYIYRAASGAQALPLPPGYAFSVPMDINDAGVIVGYAQHTWSDELNPVAWKLENGQFTIYPGLAHAEAINANGLVAGRACPSGTNLSCFFSSESGPVQTFGSTTGYMSTLWHTIDVNTSGQMALGGVPVPQAYRREVGGALTPLPPPPSPYRSTFIWSINDPGQIAGRYEYNVGSQYFSRAFIWDPASGAQTIGIPNTHVRPKGLNNLGQVVGESGANQNSYLDMWLWTPERGNEDIEPLMDQSLRIIVTGVSGINDRGQIIGRGVRQVAPVGDVFFVLTPAPPLCRPDLNGDGAINVADYLAFLSAYAAADPRTDFTADGLVNVSDFLAFLSAYSAGC